MSDAMRDFFGDVPGRPDHPDFWRLSEIVLGNDAAVEDDAEHGFEKVMGSTGVDSRSLVYVATQRAMRWTTDHEARMYGAGCWLDGFLAGLRFAERRRSGGKSEQS